MTAQIWGETENSRTFWENSQDYRNFRDMSGNPPYYFSQKEVSYIIILEDGQGAMIWRCCQIVGGCDLGLRFDSLSPTDS